MKIRNLTKKTTLSEDAVEAKSLFARTKGLLGDATSHTLILHTHFGIHTLGMKFPIDILILSPEHKVVKLRKHLQPNSVFLWNPKYFIVIELPRGTIVASRTQISDILSLTSNL